MHVGRAAKEGLATIEKLFRAVPPALEIAKLTVYPGQTHNAQMFRTAEMRRWLFELARPERIRSNRRMGGNQVEIPPEHVNIRFLYLSVCG